MSATLFAPEGRRGQPVVLGRVAAPWNSLRALCALRSDNHGESDHEAGVSCGTPARPAPCAPRRSHEGGVQHTGHCFARPLVRECCAPRTFFGGAATVRLAPQAAHDEFIRVRERVVVRVRLNLSQQGACLLDRYFMSCRSHFILENPCIFSRRTVFGAENESRWYRFIGHERRVAGLPVCG